jgi:hypothetical protein
MTLFDPLKTECYWSPPELYDYYETQFTYMQPECSYFQVTGTAFYHRYLDLV